MTAFRFREIPSRRNTCRSTHRHRTPPLPPIFPPPFPPFFPPPPPLSTRFSYLHDDSCVRYDLCDVAGMVVVVVCVCVRCVSADSFQIHLVPSVHACIAIAPHNIPIESRWRDINDGWLDRQPSRFRPSGSDRAVRVEHIRPFRLVGGWQEGWQCPSDIAPNRRSARHVDLVIMAHSSLSFAFSPFPFPSLFSFFFISFFFFCASTGRLMTQVPPPPPPPPPPWDRRHPSERQVVRQHGGCNFLNTCLRCLVFMRWWCVW